MGRLRHNDNIRFFADQILISIRGCGAHDDGIRKLIHGHIQIVAGFRGRAAFVPIRQPFIHRLGKSGIHRIQGRSAVQLRHLIQLREADLRLVAQCGQTIVFLEGGYFGKIVFGQIRFHPCFPVAQLGGPILDLLLVGYSDE
ncbi:hypothetical protein D3C76_1193450 [compost metagenome]